MINKRMVFAVWLALGLPAAGLADEPYDACLRAYTGDRGGKCAREWLGRAEVAMQQQWERLLLVTEAGTKSRIVAEQQAWQAFRADACQFYADPAAFGPEVQEAVMPACIANVIGVRAGQLRDYIRNIDP